jgi:signal peptidase II
MWAMLTRSPRFFARFWTAIPLVLLIGATVGCDRVTKQFAAATLSSGPRHSFLADTIRLEYAENPGAFLGLGATWPRPIRTGLFTFGNGIVLAALVMMAASRRWSRPMLAGMALLFAGGLSNLTDRAIRGNVVDFMNVGVGPLRTGIFNVADVAITAGAVLVAWRLYRLHRAREHSATPTVL